MSWQRKSSPVFAYTCALLASLTLSGCGFEPLYSKEKSEQHSELSAGVKIDSIPGRLGQIFRSKLEDSLNPSGGIPNKPAYRLQTKIDHINVPISVARDGTVSRFNIHFNSEYVLIRTEDQVPVTSGKLSYITSYNNLTNVYFSTYVSEQDALKRGTTALSELYRQRLSAYLAKGAPVDAIITMPGKGSPIPADSLIRQQQGNTINLK